MIKNIKTRPIKETNKDNLTINESFINENKSFRLKV